jgi:hypothetical protein
MIGFRDVFNKIVYYVVLVMQELSQCLAIVADCLAKSAELRRIVQVNPFFKSFEKVGFCFFGFHIEPVDSLRHVYIYVGQTLIQC